jgi:carbohydrate-selective porin OprB
MVPHLGSTAGDARGVSGFIQLGVNDSRTMIATRYFGLGVTAFGVIPGRPIDSLGAGFAWSRLNRNLRPDETLVSVLRPDPNLRRLLSATRSDIVA